MWGWNYTHMQIYKVMYIHTLYTLVWISVSINKYTQGIKSSPKQTEIHLVSLTVLRATTYPHERRAWGIQINTSVLLMQLLVWELFKNSVTQQWLPLIWGRTGRGDFCGPQECRAALGRPALPWPPKSARCAADRYVLTSSIKYKAGRRGNMWSW